MFLLRKRKMILNFGKMLDIMPKFDIITVAFQRQQVAQAVSPAEDGKSILIAYTVLVSLDTGTVSFF